MKKKVKKGGNFFVNLGRGATTDRKIGNNYFETKIKYKNVDYLVRYIVSNNYLIFKSVDQVVPPKFTLMVEGKRVEGQMMITENDINYPITMLLQISPDPKNISGTPDLKPGWYAIISATDQIIKTSSLFDYRFYAFSDGIFSNNEDVITLLNRDSYTKLNCNLLTGGRGLYSGKKNQKKTKSKTPETNKKSPRKTQKKIFKFIQQPVLKNICTILFPISSYVREVEKKSIEQNILFNFYLQQQAQEFVKDEAVIIPAEMATSIIF